MGLTRWITIMALALLGAAACSNDGDDDSDPPQGTDGTETTTETVTADTLTGDSATETGSETIPTDSGSSSASDTGTGTDTGTGEDTGEAPDTSPRVGLDEGDGRDGLIGWNILQPSYVAPNLLDMISFEWDYFMIHDDAGGFTGSIGYLIANPRNKDLAGLGLGDLVPKGGNVAVAGKFGEGAAYLAEYKNFGPKGYKAGKNERSFDADMAYIPVASTDPVVTTDTDSATVLDTDTAVTTDTDTFALVDTDTAVSIDTDSGVPTDSATATDTGTTADPEDAIFAKQIPVPAAGAEQQQLLLQGQTEKFAWDLTVRQDWFGLSSNHTVFVPEQGNDIGTLTLPGVTEVWNVNMVWPRTLVTGTITNRATGDVVAIDGHGYRENSWGRWAFNLGGWDFATLSDKDAKIMWAWQTYHNQSVELDYVDLGFLDEDNLMTLLHFDATDGEVGSIHNEWFYDEGARQCMPLDTTVVAENDDYRVEATVTLGHEQVPMLSDATTATREFVIEIQFPWVEGTITRKADNKVTPFAGQGGGEFANARRGAGQPKPTDAECSKWGQKFSSPLPGQK